MNKTKKNRTTNINTILPNGKDIAASFGKTTDLKGRRLETIRVLLKRNYTNPDIVSVISIFRGPKDVTNISDIGGIIEYLNWYFKQVDEDISVMKNGKFKSPYSEEVYTFTYNDKITPRMGLSTTPIDCNKYESPIEKHNKNKKIANLK